MITNEIIGGIACVLAVVGVLLNNRKMIGCFYFWIESNSLGGLLHWAAGQYTLCARDVIFLALAVAGFWKWRNEKNKIAALEGENEQLKAENEQLKTTNKQLYNRLAPFMLQEGNF